MRRTRRTLRRIFGVTLATFVALTSGPLPVLSDQPRQPLALLGFNLPTLASDLSYFSAANLSDIKNALHADFVRTGWAPNWMPHQPRLKQRLTDAEIHGICGAGLKLMIIVPGKTHDKAGLAHLEDSIAWFFQRYTQREPGCIRWAEIANEADLPVNGFADVRDYASYYESVAPIVASFGIPVLTSGVSGKDLPWTSTLAGLLNESSSQVAGFGFHPYGVPPGDLRNAVSEVREAARAFSPYRAPEVYVTEIGQTQPEALYQTIVNLACVTPVITVYEYEAHPDESSEYGLKEHPELYQAVRRAWTTLHDPAGGKNPCG